MHVIGITGSYSASYPVASLTVTCQYMARVSFVFIDSYGNLSKNYFFNGNSMDFSPLQGSPVTFIFPGTGSVVSFSGVNRLAIVNNGSGDDYISNNPTNHIEVFQITSSSASILC